MKKTLRIPLIIDANGKWCAYGYHGAGADPDWSMMDDVADSKNPLVGPQQYWVTVEVDVREVREVAAVNVEAA